MQFCQQSRVPLYMFYVLILQKSYPGQRNKHRNVQQTNHQGFNLIWKKQGLEKVIILGQCHCLGNKLQTKYLVKLQNSYLLHSSRYNDVLLISETLMWLRRQFLSVLYSPKPKNKRAIHISYILKLRYNFCGGLKRRPLS